MTALTLGRIAESLGGSLDGEASLVIKRIRGFEEAGAAEIAVVWDSRHFAAIPRSEAAALVVPDSCSAERRNLIRVADAKHATITLISMFAAKLELRYGVEEGAFVASSAQLGERVFIARGAQVREDVVAGDDVRIHGNTIIGAGCVIGEGTEIHPNVTIYPGTRIGARVVIHAGSVIGADGFGYTRHEGAMQKIPHIGIVEIEDDVEIGANCTIDRATLEVTRIRRGAKIDNLVQIGHNSDVGRNVVLVSQVGVSGNVNIGDDAMVGGQAGIADHVKVGAGVAIGAQSGVHSDLLSGVWLGSPALPREQAGRMFAALPHLPDYRERVRALEARLAEMQALLESLQEKGELVDGKNG